MNDNERIQHIAKSDRIQRVANEVLSACWMRADRTSGIGQIIMIPDLDLRLSNADIVYEFDISADDGKIYTIMVKEAGK